MTRTLTLPVSREAMALAVEKELCSRSLAHFIRAAWPYVEHRRAYKHNWHIDLIALHLEAITDELMIEDDEGGEAYYNRLLINVPPGAMKALDEDTPVLTLEGWKRHADLFAGDYVFSPSGRPVMVQAATQEAVEDAYRVTFDDGEEIVAGAGHEWVVEREFVDKSTNWKRERRPMTVSTLELWSQASTNGTYSRPDRIRVADPIYMPKRPLLIDPYVLGAWLGDGGKDGGGIYAAELDAEHFSQLGEAKMTADSSTRGQAFYRVTVPGLSAALRARGLIHNKHVPDEYLFASYDDRLSLLQGLMDTDGCAHKTGQCSFSNKNEQIARSMAYLVASLGAKPFVSSRYTMLNGKRYGPHYKVEFRPPEDLRVFRLERKQSRVGYMTSDRGKNRYVISVEPVGPRKIKCIQVEGGVYLAGNHLVPTHNSLLVNVFWGAWEWGPKNLPHTRIICASHTVGLSKRDGIKMRRLVTSDWYQKHWGDRVKLTGDQNQVTKFENTFGGFRQACAITGMTGARADRVIIDDPHSVDSAKSDAERTNTIETFEEAVPSRLDDPEKSAIVVIMQRLHEDDVSGVILDRGFGYDHLMYPMRFEPARSFPSKLGYEDPRTIEGELFFPDRFPLHVVERDEQIMGQWGVAGQFQQIPVPRGGGIIHPSWWRLWKKPVYEGIEYILMSLDTAYTEKAENDPSALTVWGVYSDAPDGEKATTLKVDRYGKVLDYSGFGVRSSEDLGAVPRAVMMYAWTGKKKLNDLVMHVAAVAKRMKVDKILIENKAAGHSVAQELRRLFGAEDFFVQMYDPKTIDKVARLHTVQPMFAEGMIYAPDKDWAEMVIRQVASFPKSKHDDLVDCVSMSIKHLRDIGMLARTVEKQKEHDASMRFLGNKQDAPLY